MLKMSTEEQQNQGKKQLFDGYIKYSGMAIQMIAMIGIFSFIGYKADQYFGLEKPLITLAGLLFGTGGSIFLIIRQLKE